MIFNSGGKEKMLISMQIVLMQGMTDLIPRHLGDKDCRVLKNCLPSWRIV